MRLLLRLDPARTRRWTVRLADRLAAVPGAILRIETVSGTPPASAVSLLLAFERMVLHRSRPGAADAAELPASADDGGVPDLVIDLAGLPPPAGTATLQVLYDGSAGEDALFASILAGRLPLIEITDEQGVVRGRANPSPETAGGLSGGIDAVSARVVTLLEKLVRARASGLAPVRLDRTSSPVLAPRPMPLFAGRNLAALAVRALYRLCCHAPHWRIGWRLHDGPGVLETGDLSGPRWHVLADPGDHFYADPVPVVWQGRTVLFFEDLDHRHGKGVISGVEFGPDGPVGPVFPVLEDPWHLSYPFLIEHGGALYMIPETTGNRDVAVYRCVEFPGRWERCAVLLSGLEAADVTITTHGGREWMFTATRDEAGGWSDTLSLFHAPDLFGPWQAHPLNPVLIDRDSARPAGNMVRIGDRLLRPVQDCSGGYGSALGLAEVTRLDPDGFAQEMRSIVRPGPRWPGRKLHTLNRAGRLEVIDGTTYRPKLPALARIADRRFAPRG